MSVNSFNASNPPLTTKGDLYGFSTVPVRVPVGTNGQVLTADSTNANGVAWASASAAAKSYTLINTGGTALTGATDITVSGFSGYNDIFIRVLNAESVNGSSSIKVTVNSGSGGATAQYATFYVTDAATNTIDVDTNTGGYWLSNYAQMGGASNNRVDHYINITAANSSGVKPYQWTTVASNSTGGISSTGTGIITNANAITSVLINSSTGNFDGGTIYVYGAL